MALDLAHDRLVERRRTPRRWPSATTKPLSSSISVRRPRITSWSSDGRPAARPRRAAPPSRPRAAARSLPARPVDDSAGRRCPSIGSTSWPAARADLDHLGRRPGSRSAAPAARSDLGRAVAAQAGQRVGHAVGGHLGPALAEQVGGELGQRRRRSSTSTSSRARSRVAAVELADLEADASVPIGRSAAPCPGSYRPAPMVMTQPSVRCATGHGRDALVVDAVLEVDDHAVGLASGTAG